MAIKSRQTSYGMLILEQGSGGYVIYLDGKLYRGPYNDLSDAIEEFDSLSN